MSLTNEEIEALENRYNYLLSRRDRGAEEERERIVSTALTYGYRFKWGLFGKDRLVRW